MWLMDRPGTMKWCSNTALTFLWMGSFIHLACSQQLPCYWPLAPRHNVIVISFSPVQAEDHHSQTPVTGPFGREIQPSFLDTAVPLRSKWEPQQRQLWVHRKEEAFERFTSDRQVTVDRPGVSTSLEWRKIRLSWLSRLSRWWCQQKT